MGEPALKVAVSNMVKIDKGIPCPDPRPDGGRPAKYPWLAMEIGDSFLALDNQKYFSTTKANKDYAPRKFTARKTPEGNRVWRIA